VETDAAALRSQRAEQLLAKLQTSAQPITSIELAALCGLPHIQAVNLLGHLKRQGLIEANLIRDCAHYYSAYYLISRIGLPRHAADAAVSGYAPAPLAAPAPASS
jgi:hypothetical protein